jgi:hypothetical protein
MPIQFGGHAEFIIGRAFARPGGFAHPTVLERGQPSSGQFTIQGMPN